MISGIDIEDMLDSDNNEAKNKEKVESIRSVLEEKNIAYAYSEQAKMFKLYNEETGKTYQFFYTTGKWGVYRMNDFPNKHYNSKSIQDFLERFFYKKEYENKS